MSVPLPTPETVHFWKGALNDQLLLQRCCECKRAYFPPRPFCPYCLSRKIEVFAASGKATLYSYVISHLAPPGWPNPFTMALVDLEEGPRLLTNIVDIAPKPENLRLDMPLEVTFRSLSPAFKLPVFRPAGLA